MCDMNFLLVVALVLLAGVVGFLVNEACNLKEKNELKQKLEDKEDA